MSAHGGMGGGGPRRGGPGGLRGGPPGMRAANPEDNVSRDAKGALLRLARLLRPAWLRVLTVVVLTLVVTIANVITPKLLGDATNVIVDGIESNGVNFTRLAHILLIVAVLYIGANVIQFLSGILLRYIVQQMGYELRRDAQAKIDRLPLDFIDKKARGDLLSRVTNDVDNITSTLQATLSRIIDSIYTFIGVVIMMFYLSWSLSLISLLILPVGVVVTAFVIKRAQPHFTAQWENTGKVSTIVEESFTGLDVVSAYGLGEDFAEAYDESNDKLFESSYKAQILSQLSMPIMTLASNLSFVAIAVIGGLKVISGTMTIGGIQAFIQ
ncbi:MAG: ABC transporter ATP-binding protein, partial [Actinomycetaceae bacterium]|nr:ABC transporter ATP-binding protein [Actinomycetaceae bacterium]